MVIIIVQDLKICQKKSRWIQLLKEEHLIPVITETTVTVDTMSVIDLSWQNIWCHTEGIIDKKNQNEWVQNRKGFMYNRYKSKNWLFSPTQDFLQV